MLDFFAIVLFVVNSSLSIFLINYFNDSLINFEICFFLLLSLKLFVCYVLTSSRTNYTLLAICMVNGLVPIFILHFSYEGIAKMTVSESMFFEYWRFLTPSIQNFVYSILLTGIICSDILDNEKKAKYKKRR